MRDYHISCSVTPLTLFFRGTRTPSPYIVMTEGMIMSALPPENSKKLFNLAKLEETAEVDTDTADDGALDSMRLKKFFRPTIFNLSDAQESSPAAL